MTNINYDYIENYLREIIPEKTGYLKEMRKYAKENHVPIVEEETEEFLKFLLYMKKPKKILEMGTAIGYSSSVFAKDCPSIEKITTIEIRDDMADIAEKNIEKLGFSDVIEVKRGDAAKVIETIEEEYDMIFIDAAKG